MKDEGWREGRKEPGMQGWRRGRNEGCRDGGKEGRNEGWRDGRNEGCRDGKNEGCRDKRNEGFRDVLQVKTLPREGGWDTRGSLGRAWTESSEALPSLLSSL